MKTYSVLVRFGGYGMLDVAAGSRTAAKRTATRAVKGMSLTLRGGTVKFASSDIHCVEAKTAEAY